METKNKSYNISCKGDACVGDRVEFERAVFTGSYRNAKFSHDELITGQIVKDSYGSEKQQHTFTILKTDGEEIRIKGRNLYRNGCYRQKWEDESKRQLILEAKHDRGDRAKKAKSNRLHGDDGSTL